VSPLEEIAFPLAQRGGDGGGAVGNRNHVGNPGHVGLILAPEAGALGGVWPASHSVGQHLPRGIDGLG